MAAELGPQRLGKGLLAGFFQPVRAPVLAGNLLDGLPNHRLLGTEGKIHGLLLFCFAAGRMLHSRGSGKALSRCTF
ncbi:MAG: hypothetical protein KatS3mg131_3592 [Candidatus Tectimicrobiota bacterium]|nr:MAG: hypothetical protein KatS3mg131_3592 [Candidatus Tectomicrobia bacterium]